VSSSKSSVVLGATVKSLFASTTALVVTSSVLSSQLVVSASKKRDMSKESVGDPTCELDGLMRRIIESECVVRCTDLCLV
jgi:hypothetical protein